MATVARPTGVARAAARALDTQLEGLTPAYFALVMATGAVSLAVDLYGLRVLAGALFAINIAAYLTL